MWTHLWHDAGNFPLRLAPDQVCVITLNDDEALISYAKPIVAELREIASGGAKISNAA